MSLSKEELFESIRLARPLLILFICVAHMPGINGYKSAYDQFDQPVTLFTIYLKDFLARGAVPILTVLSGYLAYYSFSKRSYVRFLSDKFKRLLMPFLLWNVLLFGISWGLFTVFHRDFAGVTHLNNAWAVIKALFGIYRLPINAPTYFLRDLFVIMMVLPGIHFICKTPWRLAVTVAVYLYIYWDIPGVVIPFGSFYIPLTFRMDMVLFFTLGYYMAYHGKSIPKPSVYTCVTYFVLMFFIGLLFSSVTSAINPSAQTFVQWRALVGALFVCIAPAILLTLLSIKHTLLGRLLAWLSPYSFTLFLSHILSAYVFILLVRFEWSWRVKESSPIYEQMAYMVCYLVVVSFGAVVILSVWRRLVAKWQQVRARSEAPLT